MEEFIEVFLKLLIFRGEMIYVFRFIVVNVYDNLEGKFEIE